VHAACQRHERERLGSARAPPTRRSGRGCHPRPVAAANLHPTANVYGQRDTPRAILRPRSGLTRPCTCDRSVSWEAADAGQGRCVGGDAGPPAVSDSKPEVRRVVRASRACPRGRHAEERLRRRVGCRLRSTLRLPRCSRRLRSTRGRRRRRRCWMPSEGAFRRASCLRSLRSGRHRQRSVR
jgi:hypothetical protein